ncbi:uncharacterized protein LOC6539983 [Drosophila yakuba]|uniref:Uncharacterized protein n=1 Tax=Drosophila yakuba TaxID=7245 RepID=B4IV46_DROYA|nr:uncharacterized protein LOC6539983 [Drosophila yakuba]EDX00723.1 uncharacterized protein Dyak_GE11014 [Drosophila yakuba]
MCDVRNLIDLSEWDEPTKEPLHEEPEDSVVATNFEVPYDPFDLMEKEACIKGMTLTSQIKEKVSSAERQYPDLESESPPVCMQTDAATASGPGSGETTQKRRSNSSFQKQLLKLNASRSVVNTPTHSRSKTEFERTILNENLQMLAAESPLKLIEDDDVLSNSINFEEDLKMLRIPILDALNNAEPNAKAEENQGNVNRMVDVRQESQESPHTPIEDRSNGKSLSQLLEQLKILAHEHVERSKWHLFDTAIESIAAVIFGPGGSCPEGKKGEAAISSPYSYTRQGTFDLELQGKKTKRSLDANHIEEEEIDPPGSDVQNFPDAMVCSTATFDGESRLNPFDRDSLPSLPSITSIPSVSEARKEPFMTELVDETLAQQINQLLERHKLANTGISDHEQQHGVDPRTVILLVNPSNYSSTQVACNVSTNNVAKTKPMPLSESNAAVSMRRRSSSLSIQDKCKLPREVLKSDRQVENLPPPREVKNTATVGPMAAAAAFRQRSNSFSTPSNPSTKAYESRRTLMSSRLRNPSINESMGKPNGMLKVTKPIKPVVPIMKVTASNESTYLNPVHPRIPETPISTRTKPIQKISCTSTPLPQMRIQQRRSLKPMAMTAGSGSMSNTSYSTPSIRGPSFCKKTGSG